MRGNCHSRVFAAIFCAAAVAAAPATADDERPALDSNDFVIDTYTGPVIGSIRTMTLGGAYAGIAERSQGIMYNPAAVAQRVWYSKYFFDYDAGYAYLKPGLFTSENVDLDNDGDRSFTYKNFISGAVYGALRAGKAGGGALLRLQRFVLQGEQERRMPVVLGHADMAAGYNFLEDRLVVAAGVRLTFMTIDVWGIERKSALAYRSAGILGGILFRFKRLPLRAGISTVVPLPRAQTARTEGVETCELPGGGSVRKVGVDETCAGEGMVIPGGIAFPWTIRLGFAYYLGLQDWNEQWTMEDRRYEYSSKVPVRSGGYKWSSWQSRYMMKRGDVDRRYVLFSLDVEIVGGVEKGIGVEGFLDQEWKRSFGSPTVSIHAGVESEVWRDRLVIRLGGYAEPSRFKRMGYRGHGTFGFSAKLFSLCSGSSKVDIRGGVGADIARGYLNAGFTLGFWK